MKRIPRMLALTALALAVGGLAGCSEFSQQTTALEYTPADGAQLDLQDGVGVRNAILLSDGGGAPATLVASLVNNGDEDATVTLTGDGVDGSFQVDAGEVLMIGPEGDEQLRVDSLAAHVGELVTLQVASGAAADELKVPVLDGTQPEFEDLVPTATATSSAAPTGSTTETASPTATATATTTP